MRMFQPHENIGPAFRRSAPSADWHWHPRAFDDEPGAGCRNRRRLLIGRRTAGMSTAGQPEVTGTEEFQSMGVERQHRSSRAHRKPSRSARAASGRKNGSLITASTFIWTKLAFRPSAQSGRSQQHPDRRCNVPPAAGKRAATLGDARLASFTTEPDTMRALFGIYKKALPDGKNPEKADVPRMLP